MKRLQVHEIVKSWHKMIIVLSCVCLTACSERIDICKPIDVLHAGQSVKIDFEISNVKAYSFALLFTDGNSREEKEKRLKLLSDHVDGVAIPISFRLIKDGKVLFDEEIDTVGARSWGESIYYKEKKINTLWRYIEIFQFTPGHYSVVITTLEDMPEFNGIESFVQLRPFPN
ncbi:DUF5625 family protein [Photorhabdus luminescens]|uniref:DUF5625 domain-containing protein n=1 Tax=Photorhabdus luminescens subsp. sonorensis TaxID=1173677 RepID=A0A5C4RCG1_PHOLU|nr:DUF5625 family protein [Photorhabdus luminescens]TNH41626.1 hypothetical protein EP164_21475 [Photorhabdus luminescens subsp. sonorensis]